MKEPRVCQNASCYLRDRQVTTDLSDRLGCGRELTVIEAEIARRLNEVFGLGSEPRP